MVLDILACCRHCNKTRKRNKRHTANKGRNEKSLFVDDMIVNAENLKESTKKQWQNQNILLQLRNESGKVTGYRITIQKSIVFLCISNEPDRLNRVTTSVIPKFIYGFDAMPIKIPTQLFCGYKQDCSVIYMMRQRS